LAESATKLRKLSALDGAQWAVLVGTPFVLLLSWVRLRTLGYLDTLARTQPVRETSLDAEELLVRAEDTSYAFAVAVKFGPWRPRCLLRSVALAWFLGRRGIPFEIRIGVPSQGSAVVGNPEPGFSAHAWVEHAGIVLNDREDVASQYSAFGSGSGAQ
jgi:hypothetical protein